MLRGGKIVKKISIRRKFEKRGWKLRSRISTGIILEKGDWRVFLKRGAKEDPHIYKVR